MGERGAVGTSLLFLLVWLAYCTCACPDVLLKRCRLYGVIDPQYSLRNFGFEIIDLWFLQRPNLAPKFANKEDAYFVCWSQCFPWVRRIHLFVDFLVSRTVYLAPVGPCSHTNSAKWHHSLENSEWKSYIWIQKWWHLNNVVNIFQQKSIILDPINSINDVSGTT